MIDDYKIKKANDITYSDLSKIVSQFFGKSIFKKFLNQHSSEEVVIKLGEHIHYTKEHWLNEYERGKFFVLQDSYFTPALVLTKDGYKIKGSNGIFFDSSLNRLIRTLRPNNLPPVIDESSAASSSFDEPIIEKIAPVSVKTIAPCQTEEMLKIKKQYLDIIARGKTVGANWAVKMLEHWIQGSGEDLLINTDVLRSFSLITDAEETIRERIEIARKENNRDIVKKLIDGEEKEYFIYSHEKLTALPYSELFYASGTSTLTGRIILKVKRENNTITMKGTLEFHWWDPYDWHIGLDAYIPGIGTIKDADAKKYEDTGCAKTFDMYNFWHQSFSDIYKIDDVLGFYDTEDIKWGALKMGRSSVIERGTFKDWVLNRIKGVTGAHGKYLPGLSKKTSSPSNPPQRRDREERDREDTRREERRR